MGQGELISAKGIEKIYNVGANAVRVLNGIDLSLNSGQSLAIMGPSGSGKSTLLYILGCLAKPSRGSYRLEGREVSALDDVELSLVRAKRIGFVFQTFNLIPQFSVLENVIMPFAYSGSSLVEARPLAEKALARVHMQHRLDHRPGQLSGGEMQRVAIARALANEPLVLLADEPTGSLDMQNTNNILELFRELNAEGVTMVIVTHDGNVARYCHRQIVLIDGRIHDG